MSTLFIRCSQPARHRPGTGDGLGQWIQQSQAPVSWSSPSRAASARLLGQAAGVAATAGRVRVGRSPRRNVWGGVWIVVGRLSKVWVLKGLETLENGAEWEGMKQPAIEGPWADGPPWGNRYMLGSWTSTTWGYCSWAVKSNVLGLIPSSHICQPCEPGHVT